METIGNEQTVPSKSFTFDSRHSRAPIAPRPLTIYVNDLFWGFNVGIFSSRNAIVANLFELISEPDAIHRVRRNYRARATRANLLSPVHGRAKFKGGETFNHPARSFIARLALTQQRCMRGAPIARCAAIYRARSLNQRVSKVNECPHCLRART